MRKLLFIIFLIVAHSPSHAMEQVAKKQKTCSELVWDFGRAVRYLMGHRTTLLRTVSKSELIKKMPFELQQRLVHQNIIPSTEALIKLHVARHLAQLEHDLSILDRHGKQAWQYGERLELYPEAETIREHWHAKIAQEYERFICRG